MKYTSYILLDRVSIQAANTISSPLTYGMPALTGFLGSVHALSRRLSVTEDLQLDGVLLACHDYQLQAYREHPYADYTFNQTRNPIKKDGKTSSIIEEGKIHLTVSLIIEVISDEETYDDLINDSSGLCQLLQKLIMQKRMAGGSVTDIREISWLQSSELDDLKKKLLPGFILMDAKQDLIDITEKQQKRDPQTTAIDTLIDIAALHHEPPNPERVNKPSEWIVSSAKTGRGWLTPIPVGYQGISPQFDAGKLANCRNPEYPSQYVESLYSLGKWVFPSRIVDLKNCFWRYSNPDIDLYLIEQTDLETTSPKESNHE